MITQGTLVDIIFPATCASKEEISQIELYVKKIGLIPRILSKNQTTPRVESGCVLPSYCAQNRFKQLYEALKNDESNLVWCVRGGYGSGDLLPLLAQAQPIKQQKLLIGFSDITSIATFLQQQWGWKILHAPMLIQLIEGGSLSINKNTETELIDIISGKKETLEYGLTPLNNVSKVKAIRAEITGGCLSVICGHFGGNYQINFNNKILFLEDIGESGEKLDRYFRQIIEVILKERTLPKAIIMGNFLVERGVDLVSEANVDLAINNLLDRINENKLEIPVFQAKDDLGHSHNMRSLLLGENLEIDLIKSKATLQIATL